MSRWLWRISLTLIGGAGLAPSGGYAQSPVDQVGRDRRPRFFFETATARTPLNVTRMPVLMRRIALDLDNIPVKDAVATIARNAGIELVYGLRSIDTTVRVQLRVGGITVAGALTEVLLQAGGDVDVVFNKPGFATLVARRQVPALGVIAGRVTDRTTQAPIASAQVSIVGTSLSRYTDEKGQYRIPDVPAGDHDMMVRRLGFEAVTRKMHVTDGETVTLDLALGRVATSLSEVVTTATGERSRVEVGNAIGTIKADSVVATTLIRNMSDLLTARTPGVVVTNSSGLVGSPSTIRIRGVASVSLSNDPIIILDGIRLTPASNAGLATNIGSSSLVAPQGFTGNGRSRAPSRLDDIDPNSIESIDVLRGPSASSLYGTDAAAGIIVIKTKQGSAGPVRFGILADQGTSHIPGSFPLSWVGYGHLTNGTPIANCILYTMGAPNVVDRTCVQDSIRAFQPLNDPRLTTLGTGTATNLSANLSGGTDQLREFLSVRVSDATGITKLSDAEQDRIIRMWGETPPAWMRHPNTEQNISAASRTSIRASHNLDFSFTANGLYRNTLSTNSGTFEISGTSLPSNALAAGFYDTLQYLPAEAQRARRTSLAKRGYGSGTASYTPLSWLVFRGTLGGDYTLRTDDGLGRSSDCTAVLFPAGCPSGHINSRGETFVTTFDLGAQATWVPRAWISFRTSIGEQYNHTTFYNLTAGNNSGTNLAFGTELLTPSPVTTTTGAQLYTVSENRDESATAGWYVEETLALRERLFLTGAFRQDVASAFGRNVNAKAPIYPKISLSWVLSDEPMMPTLPYVSSLRVRAAYGHSGQEARQGAVLNSFVTGNTIVDGAAVPGIVLGGYGNANLRPERTAEVEGGLDLSLFENERVHVEATLYHKLSNDAISSASLPPSYGVGNALGSSVLTQSVNLGKVENRGWELATTMKLLDGRMVAWDLTVNATRNVNKLVSSTIATLPQIGSTGNYVGYPLGSIFGHRVVGYTDFNGDGILTYNEMQVDKQAIFRGTTTPQSELTYASTLALWGGAVQVSANVDQVNGLARTLQFGTGANAIFGYVAYRALVDRTAPLDEQAAVQQGLMDTNNSWSGKTNTLRLSELSLTWNMPRATAAKFLRSRSAALTFAGRNLAYWTTYAGKDPNVANFSGTGNLQNDSEATDTSLPQPRTWILRVNLGY